VGCRKIDRWGSAGFEDNLVSRFPEALTLEQLLGLPGLSEEDREEIRWSAAHGAERLDFGEVACIREGGLFKVLDGRSEAQAWYHALLAELGVEDGARFGFGDPDLLLRLDRANERVRLSQDPAYRVRLLEAGGAWARFQEAAQYLAERFGQEALMTPELARDALSAIRAALAGALRSGVGWVDASELPLCQAVLDGQAGEVWLLIMRNEPLEGRDGHGLRAVDYAAREGSLGLVHLLLQAGSNPLRRTPDGCTLLHLAMERPDAALVRYLVELGLDVNARDLREATPLHLAAIWACPEVVEYLVASGAEVNALAGEETPLDSAMWVRNRENARTLKRHGARFALDLR
jgi:hypothetical protein